MVSWETSWGTARLSAAVLVPPPNRVTREIYYIHFRLREHVFFKKKLTG